MKGLLNMAKKSDGGFLRQAATSAGHLAGFVEGAIESVAHAVTSEKEPVHQDVRFEKSDLAHRGVLIGGACFIGGLWLTVAFLFFYFAYLKNHRAEVSPPALPITRSGAALPPQPRLQSSPEQDLKTFRAREDWELTHYYWLDRSKGRVAIPIEQAVQTIAARGIAPQNAAPNSTLTPPQEGTRSTGFEGKVNPEPR